VSIYREAQPPDTWGLAYALTLEGAALDSLEQRTQAQQALTESAQLAQSLGARGKWVAAWSHLFLAASQLDEQKAREGYEASVGLFRELGDVAQLGVALAHAAWFYLRQGDLENAERCVGEGMQATEQTGDRLGAAWYHILYGDLARRQGDLTKAAEFYAAALERFEQLGMRKGMMQARERIEMTVQ
jgi:tetratricopeptide (TPR) repeat protein